MVTRIELKELAKTRLKEAKVLYEKGLYDGCCYLAGYVIELALKARICRVLDMEDYPETGEISRSFKTHKLTILMSLAGLERKFYDEAETNPKLLANWSIIMEWSESIRYSPVGSNPKAYAQEMLSALEDPNDGVFIWLKKRW